ncbi:DUF5819 family protein [Streptomyces sp. NRRL F-5727]|uniref:DUF5819 family protein n=1 Tax=Streptomyces sp. NRRL F-5727 TaxID=1463871 RepID=UPI0006922FD2|nr:DUF5819 family protein [Streptomyces sp. NRRL F-5727]
MSAHIDGSGERRPAGGILALSMPYQVVAAVALAALAVLACLHLAMVFLHVAPSNTITKQHGQAVDDWIYPEFEQNWKLFAPNPLQQNVSVEVRAEVADASGIRRTTGWIDLTAQDVEDVRGNVFPSHTQQNQLRRAIDWYGNAHDDEGRPKGMRGRLSEQYMRRIVLPRIEGPQARADVGGTVERIQLRRVLRPVQAPHWSTEKRSTTPSISTMPWWDITDADRSRTETSR